MKINNRDLALLWLLRILLWITAGSAGFLEKARMEHRQPSWTTVIVLVISLVVITIATVWIFFKRQNEPSIDVKKVALTAFIGVPAVLIVLAIRTEFGQIQYWAWLLGAVTGLAWASWGIQLLKALRLSRQEKNS